LTVRVNPRATTSALPVFLDANEKYSSRTEKVVHDALLADRYGYDG